MGRRYVMGNNSEGRSDILTENEVSFPVVGGVPIVDLWINGQTPADPDENGDPDGRTLLHEPPDGGAIFRLVKFEPGVGDGASPEEMHAIHMAIHSAHVPSVEYLRQAKHPSMHKTDTLNYFVVLSGEMWALTEGRDVLVKPGDVMIQKGCMHGWRVEGPEPCVLAAILIDSHPA